MEVGIKVISEDTRTRVINHVLSSYITMVAVDENGKSVEIPQIKISEEKQKSGMMPPYKETQNNFGNVNYFVFFIFIVVTK